MTDSFINVSALYTATQYLFIFDQQSSNIFTQFLEKISNKRSFNIIFRLDQSSRNILTQLFEEQNCFDEMLTQLMITWFMLLYESLIINVILFYSLLCLTVPYPCFGGSLLLGNHIFLRTIVKILYCTTF